MVRVRSVVVLVGASGGVGTSVLATAVAVRAVRAGVDTVLVDGAPIGGGLDVTLGAEQVEGLRWCDLLRLAGPADGRALLARLPAAQGVRVLSFARDGTEPSAPVAAAVLLALAQECELVVVDVPAAGGSVAAAALTEADRVVVLSGDAMRQLAALSVVTRLLSTGAGRPGAAMAVCLRSTTASGPVARVVESELRWPVRWALGTERGVAADLDHGIAPGSRGRGALVGVADELLGWALLSRAGAA